MTLRRLNEHHLKSLSLKGGRLGWSESTPVKIPHCFKSHVTVHICLKQKHIKWDKSNVKENVKSDDAILCYNVIAFKCKH